MKSMGNKVKNEHYVPRRYLKHFADNEHFFVYDKEKKEQRSGSVDDYACERFFYDVDFESLKQEMLENDPDFQYDPEMEQLLEQVDEQHIEHWFAENVETWLFDPIDKIISTYILCNPQKMESMVVIDDSTRAFLSLYLAIQIIRAKEFRESVIEMYERLPILLMKKMAKTKEEKEALDSIELKVKNKNHKKLIHAQFLMDMDYVTDFAEKLGKKIWMVGYNQTSIPFLTSDNPIVKFGHDGLQGFNSKGIEIVFPLNRKLVLILKDSESFWHEKKIDNHFVKLSSDEVNFYNSLQVQQSYRYIFDKTGDFSLVEGMMKRNPMLSNITHKRFFMR